MMFCIKILILPLTWLALYLGDNGVWALLIWGLGNVTCAAVRILYAKHFIRLDVKHYVSDVIGRILLVSVLSAPLPIWIVYRLGQGWISLLLTTLASIVLIGLTAYLAGLNAAEKQMVKKMIHERH